MVEGRARLNQAERRQRNIQKRWAPQDTSWQKFARCGVCKKTFCCNNYRDRKTRLKHLEMRGLIVCVFCRRNPEIEFIVRCVTIVENMTRKDPPKWVRKHAERKNGSYAGGQR